MEDCVDESESLTSPSNMSQKREEEEEEEEKGEEEEEEKEKGDEEREKRDGIEEKEEAGVDATEEREKGQKGESEGGFSIISSPTYLTCLSPYQMMQRQPPMRHHFSSLSSMTNIRGWRDIYACGQT